MPAPSVNPARPSDKASPSIELQGTKKVPKNQRAAVLSNSREVVAANGTHSVATNGAARTEDKQIHTEDSVFPVDAGFFKQDFFEQPNRVSVTYYLRGLTKDEVVVNFQDTSYSVILRPNDEKFFDSHPRLKDVKKPVKWDISLKHPVIAEKCSFKMTNSALELQLPKASSVTWGSLSPVEAKSQNSKAEWKPIVPVAESKTVHAPVRVPQPEKPAVEEPKEQESVVPAGYTGLENIGNTCFMNSVLQCLANTPALRNYFLSSKFQQDINKENPLGLKGNLAVAFAVLLRQLWTGKRQFIAPLALKKLIASKASQFEGYAQHDAQEFMAFLLDGLHEDLNRVREKPYTTTVESNGRPDAEVAEEAWRVHKLRNDSLIVDLFQGQYKSTLNCPVCQNVSVTFDPFLYLSLPLPRPKRKLSAFVFYHDPDVQPLRVTVAVNHDAKIKDFRAALATEAEVPPQSLRLIEAFKGRIHRILEEYISVESICPSDIIFAFETLLAQSQDDEILEIPVIQRVMKPDLPSHCSSCKKEAVSAGLKLKRCSKCCRVAYCDAGCQRSHWESHKPHCQQVPDIIGQPFVISLRPQQATYRNLYSTLRAFARYSVEATPAISGPDDERRPLFFITPINLQGKDIVAAQEMHRLPPGDDPVDLREVPCLAMDWRNDPKYEDHCVVTARSLDECCELRSAAGSDLNSTLTLDLCLQQFMQPEKLAKEEAWFCPKCKEHREATKQLALWRLPDILVVQLKRFSFKNLLWRDKIDKKVDYPLRGLDLSAYIPEPGERVNAVYDLYAVVNHYGGILTGHYTAFARCPSLSDVSHDQLGWRLMDDSRVTDLPEENVVSPAAYLLFYQRRKLTFTNPEELD